MTTDSDGNTVITFDKSDNGKNVGVSYNPNDHGLLGALAYTSGKDIHVASGQEKHFPHEAWHVEQQAQGRVQPTICQIRLG